MKFYEKNFRRLYLIEERKLDDTTFYAKVKLSPYQRGQGITVANTLRRILLNEIDCIAIESAQIKGVSHEFTVKPGIRESIPEIVSNLRKISFRCVSHFTDNLLHMHTSEHEMSKHTEQTYSNTEEKASNMKLLPRKLLNVSTGISEVRSLRSLKKTKVSTSTINPFTGSCDEYSAMYNSTAYDTCTDTMSSAYTTTIHYGQRGNTYMHDSNESESDIDMHTGEASELYSTVINTNYSIDNFKIITKCEKNTPGTLYAEDIALPTDIQCVAPKQKIATLVSPHTSLNLNILLVRSKQYTQKSPHENMQVLDFTNGTWKHGTSSMYATGVTGKQNLKMNNSEHEVNTTAHPREKYENEKGMQFQPVTAFTGASVDSSSNLLYKHEENTVKETKASVVEPNNAVMNSPFLPIDTIFNPVKKINYSIHQESYNNTRQESIFLEIWTDGSSYPLESLAKASLVMRQLFQPFTF